MTKFEFTDDQIEMIKEFDKAWIEGLREQLKVPVDWVYRSDKTNTESFNKLIDILSEYNVKFVSGSKYSNGNVRFSIFISPQGIQNIKDYANANRI